MNSKKNRLLKKIIKQDRKTVILPMDHCVSDGPIPGLENMGDAIKKVKKGGVDAIVVHKGIFKIYRKVIKNLPTLIHVSASTCLKNSLKKVLVAWPEEILNLGAQGVSIHLNLANPYESGMLKDFGFISRECERLGLPLLAMVYPREIRKGKTVTHKDANKVAHCARLAAELGADIVKIPYTGSLESFKKVVKGCPIPVVIAGGDKEGEKKMLQSIKDCINGGAAGVSVGRNAFQAKDVVGTVKKIKNVVHN